MTRMMTGMLLVAILAVAGCRTAPIYNAQDVAFAPAASSTRSLSMREVQNAIIRAGSTRGWTFEEQAAGHLVGKVTVRGKHYAEVDVLFDQQAFTINYRNSRNLNYSADNGVIHPNYNSWVNLLQQSIQTEVTTLKAS